MEKRPRIKIKWSVADKVAEGVGICMLMLLWYYALVFLPVLPDVIPVHFDAAGKADGFGSKDNLFALPTLATVLYIGMFLLNRFPHVFNYGVTTITADNALYQYTNATRMLRYMRLALVLVFLIIVLYTIHVALGKVGSFGVFLLPVTIILIFAPVTYFLVKMFRKKSAQNA